MTQLIKQDRMSGSDVDVGEEYKEASMLYHAVNCSGLCAFVYSNFPGADIFAQFMNAVTGWDYGIEELALAGERVLNTRQAFGAREGQNQATFKIPGRMLGQPPFDRGPHAGISIDKDLWVKGCFDAAGWDRETGRPRREKLIELGLGDIAEELWGY